MTSGPITLALLHRQPVGTVLRGVWVLLALITLALHASAAVDSADGGPAFANPVHTQVQRVADISFLDGCHHGGYHAHSLCAPPVILSEPFTWAVPASTSPVTPAKGTFLRGSDGRRHHPPPRCFV